MTFLDTAAVALRYLRARGIRVVLTTLAVVFGVGMVYGANAMIPAIQTGLEQATVAQGQGSLILSGSTDRLAGELSAASLDAARTVEGVTAAIGGVEAQISLPVDIDGQKNTWAFMVYGAHPGDDYGSLITLTEGRMPVEGAREMVLDSATADVTGAAVGGTLTLFRDQPPFTVTGIADIARELGALVVPYQDVLTALGVADRIDIIVVKLTPDTPILPVVEGLDAALGNPTLRNGVSFRNAQVQNTAFAVIFNVFGAISLLAGGFLISITFRTAVMERRRDLAILRAIGAERGHIVRLLVIEALLQGALGSLIGILAGHLFALLMMKLLWGISYMNVTAPTTVPFNPVAFAIAVAVGLGTGVVAGYFPARQAGRVSPLEAMRPELEAAPRRVSQVRRGLGVLLAIAGALMLAAGGTIGGFGGFAILLGALFLAPLLIAPLTRAVAPILDRLFPRVSDFVRAGVLRQPWRAAATVNLLVVGFAIFTGIVSIFGPLQSVNAQVINRTDAGTSFALYSAPDPIDPALIERVQAIENVSVVVPYFEAEATFNGQPVGVRGFDPALGTSMRSLFPQNTPKTTTHTPEDEDALVRRLAGENTALVAYGLAQAARVDVGDSITIQTPSGPRTYTVLGVVSEYFTATRSYGLVISEDALHADFPDANLPEIYIGITDRTRAPETKAALDDALDGAAFVSNKSADRDRMIEAGARGLSMFYVLGLMVMIPSALGLINTLIMSVLERTREFGLIRAVGAERGHLRRMIVGEGMLLWLLGAGIGVFCGVVIAYGAVTAFMGFAPSGDIDTTFILPVGGLAVAIIGGLTVTLLATLFPARRAARLDILGALRYE